MKIVMINTVTKERKVVKFGELIKRLQEVNNNKVNNWWINIKLLNGETISVNGHEFKREVN